MTTGCLQSPLETRDYSEHIHASWAPNVRAATDLHAETLSKRATWAHTTDTFISLKTTGIFPLDRVGRIRPSQTCSQPPPFFHTPQPVFGVQHQCAFAQSHFCLSSYLQGLHQFFYFSQVNIERTNVTSINYFFKPALDIITKKQMNNKSVPCLMAEPLSIWGNAGLCCMPWSVMKTTEQLCSFLWSAASAEIPAPERGQHTAQLQHLAAES